jgi:hypothetical protein
MRRIETDGVRKRRTRWSAVSVMEQVAPDRQLTRQDWQSTELPLGAKETHQHGAADD